MKIAVGKWWVHIDYTNDEGLVIAWVVLCITIIMMLVPVWKWW